MRTSSPIALAGSSATRASAAGSQRASSASTRIRASKQSTIGNAPSICEDNANGCSVIGVSMVVPSISYCRLAVGQDGTTRMPTQPTDPEQQRRELIAQIAALGHCLPGSITTRQMRCGRARCACKAEPPKLHGPYTYWTRKQQGRTIARLLDAEQIERYQPQIDNARRLRQLVAALEALAITTAEDAERWGRK